MRKLSSINVLAMGMLCGLLLAGLPTTASTALASNDPLIEGAKECTKYLPRYEREYAIPTHLLSAIASTESGRYHEGLRLKLPWPWTINAAGKGYFFNSKQEAIAMVRRLRAQGVQSIDVGCMQVNLYHHPNAFASLEEAFEPQTNIAYAAGFLHDLFDDAGTWKKAAADYHSKMPAAGNHYAGQVYDSWFTIIDRLREARLAVPDNATIQAATTSPDEASPRVITVASADEQPARIQPQTLPEQQGRTVAAYRSPTMKSIQVRNSYDTSAVAALPRKSGALVITPAVTSIETPQAEAPKAEPLRIQAAQPAKVIPVAETAKPDEEAATSETPAPAVAAKTEQIAVALQPTANVVPNVIPINDVGSAAAALPAAAAQIVRKSGPNFIFAN